jgi:fructose-specific phosphotransferase system IIC component
MWYAATKTFGVLTAMSGIGITAAVAGNNQEILVTIMTFGFGIITVLVGCLVTAFISHIVNHTKTVQKCWDRMDQRVDQAMSMAVRAAKSDME